MTAATRALDAAILDMVESAPPPATGRQVYYMGVGRGLYPKDPGGKNTSYSRVLRRLSAMREDDRLPWSWIADNTRWVRRADMYGGVMQAVDEWHAQYRRDYWLDQPVRVELWVESDSIASFLDRIADAFGVPLFVCRGQASRTYIYGAAQAAQALGKPIEVLYVGDWDPTGLQIDVSMAERYARYGTLDLTVTRIGVTPEQIVQHDLIGGEPKVKDPNFERFVTRCADAGIWPPMAYETEALPPAVLRQIVEDALYARVDWDRWRLTQRVEQAEKSLLARMRGTLDEAVTP